MTGVGDPGADGVWITRVIGVTEIRSGRVASLCPRAPHVWHCDTQMRDEFGGGGPDERC